MSALAIENKVGLGGYYRMRVIRPSGECREDTGWFKNVITEEGLNAFATKQYLHSCVVGSGNSTPSASDTSLDSFIAKSGGGSNTETGSQSDNPPYYAYLRREYTFSVGAAEGNVSEVGVTWNSSSTGEDLFSRALILDENEQETTITILSDEILVVEYEVRLYPDFTDSISTVTDSGDTATPHTVTARVNDFTRWEPPASSYGAGTQTGSDSRIHGDTSLGDPMVRTWPGNVGTGPQSQDYVNNSHAREFKLTYGLGAGNFPPGINFLTAKLGATGHVSYQYSIDPPIMKTNADKLELRVKVSWARR